MGPTKNATKNACIATAIVLLGLAIVGMPTVAAEGEPEPEPEPQSQDNSCWHLDPWVWPPVVDVHPWECV